MSSPLRAALLLVGLLPKEQLPPSSTKIQPCCELIRPFPLQTTDLRPYLLEPMCEVPRDTADGWIQLCHCFCPQHGFPYSCFLWGSGDLTVMKAKRAHSANITLTDQKEGPEENSGTETQVSGTLLQGAEYQYQSRKVQCIGTAVNWDLFKSL